MAPLLVLRKMVFRNRGQNVHGVSMSMLEGDDLDLQSVNVSLLSVQSRKDVFRTQKP